METSKATAEKPAEASPGSTLHPDARPSRSGPSKKVEPEGSRSSEEPSSSEVRGIPSRFSRLTRFLTKPGGIAAALVVAIGLISGAWTLASQAKSSLFHSGPSAENLIVSDQPQTSGRMFDASSDVLAPYGTNLPSIDNFVGCGSAEPIMLKQWTPLHLYDRMALENTASGSNMAIQVLDIKAKILSTSPALPGVIIECPNSQGDNSIDATIQVSDGDIAMSSSTDGKQAHPVAFSLAAGEQQVLNVTVNAGDQDMKVDLVADLIIGGQHSTKTLNSAPLVVHSRAKSASYTYGWGGKSWICTPRSDLNLSGSTPEAVEKTCESGRVFTEPEVAPSLLNSFVGTWVGHTRSLVISHDGHVHELIDDGCCTHIISLDYQIKSVTGTSIADAQATAAIVAATPGTDWTGPAPQVGQTYTITRMGAQVVDSLTQANYCGSESAVGACGA
ncbi:MAG: hypothetical protein M3Y73_02040 [Actinomycetota bacterium]|nr:hypothetical protein [Actinomycetota bacterium]